MPEKLTKREVQTLRLIAAGYPNKAMGSMLFISEKTVEKHRQALMDKLGIHNRVLLTHYALAAGLVENVFK